MLTSVNIHQITLFQRCFTVAGKDFLLLEGSLGSLQISTCVTSVSFLQGGFRIVLSALVRQIKFFYFAFLELIVLYRFSELLLDSN